MSPDAELATSIRVRRPTPEHFGHRRTSDTEGDQSLERRPTFVEGHTDSRSMHDSNAPGDDSYMTHLTQIAAGKSAVGLYRIDPVTSSVTFKTRHLFGLGPVRGSFELKDGEIHVADPVSGSWAEARVSTASFQTGNSAREHGGTVSPAARRLRAPLHHFHSTALDSANEAWALHGQLTVCGMAAPLDLEIDEVEVTTTGLRFVPLAGSIVTPLVSRRRKDGPHVMSNSGRSRGYQATGAMALAPRAQRDGAPAASVNRLFRRGFRLSAPSMAKASKKHTETGNDR